MVRFVVHDSADPALLSELAATLDTLKDCSGDSCRRADGGLDPLVP